MASLTDDGSRVLAAQVLIHRPSKKNADATFDLQYCVESTAREVAQLQAQRVALQLPDDMLTDASRLFDRLHQYLPQKTLLFILGDTTFAPCCVDEVAAQHTSADLILHYGPTCFTSTTSRIPTRYVLPLPQFDVQNCVRQLSQFRDAILQEGLQGVVLVFDSMYYRMMPAVWDVWCGRSDTTVPDDTLYGGPQDDGDGDPLRQSCCPSSLVWDGVALAVLNTKPQDGGPHISIGGMCLALPNGWQDGDYGLFLVATPQSPMLTHVLLQAKTLADRRNCDLWQCLHVFHAEEDAEGTLHSTRQHIERRLRRRAFLVEKVKEAELVGIVVASLSIAGYNTLVQRLQHVLAVLGRKSCVLMVGKPNVAKLANFDQVDLFVMITCPGHALFDDRDFPKPIVTPFELVLGLQSLVRPLTEWPPHHFGLTLEELLVHPFLQHPEDFISHSDHASDAVDISLTSGKIIPQVPRPPSTNTPANDLALVTKAEWAVIAHESPAFERLKQRTFQGLDLSGEECHEVKEGLSGIASGYTTEPPTQ